MADPSYLEEYGQKVDQLKEILVGHKVVSVCLETGQLLLDNGTVLEVQKEADYCCSYVELTGLFTTDNIITDVRIEDDEGDYDSHEGDYKAWIQVITEAGPINIATADGDASNGYYLHGFALAVTVIN